MLYYNVNLEVTEFTANVEASDLPPDLLEVFGLNEEAYAEIEVDGLVIFDPSTQYAPTITGLWLTYGDLTVNVKPTPQLREELKQRWLDQGGPFNEI
jgi:hypothetical protein